jgi:hypothetical protein
VSRYPLLKDAIWNKVLACRACNSWKGAFDPARDGILAIEKFRAQLIQRAKRYVEAQRKTLEALFVEEMALIKAALQEYEHQSAANA